MTATARRERGLIFTDTVPALIDGTKRQSRRLIKGVTPQHGQPTQSFEPHELLFERGTAPEPAMVAVAWHVGDRFYVKERWDYFGGDEYLYQRDPAAVLYEHPIDFRQACRRWRNPMFMPAWAARLRFDVTEVRVQRVQELTEADAHAEIGDALHGALDDAEIHRLAKLAGCMATDSRAWFAAAWEQIHGRGAWDRNDWVYALTFKPAPRAEGSA